MPQDTIMFIANNEEGLYNDLMALYDGWMEEGDTWYESAALEQAATLAIQFAELIHEPYALEDPYTAADIREAAEEIVEEFEEHREYVIQEATKRERAAVPRAPMTDSEIEHAEKYERMARAIGIDLLQELIPASPERIRYSLETGDIHLNTISIRKWDKAEEGIRGRGLSLAEKVSVLKHVATWHYA